MELRTSGAADKSSAELRLVVLSRATRSELTSFRSSLSEIGVRDAARLRRKNAVAPVADVDRDGRVALAMRRAKRVHQRRRQTIVFSNRGCHVQPRRQTSLSLRSESAHGRSFPRRSLPDSAKRTRRCRLSEDLVLLDVDVTSGVASSPPSALCILYVILILEKFRLINSCATSASGGVALVAPT